ncbi:hypothetical protein Hanom_Chr14g01317641 [Helianthus anomalus]
MAKIPEFDGYTRNPTQMGWVYPIPDGYWVGYGISFKNFRGYGLGMGLGMGRVYPKPDTNGTGIPDYPKPHTRLLELYTRLYTRIFLFIFLIFINFCLLVIYFSI